MLRLQLILYSLFVNRQKKGSPEDKKNPCVDYPTESFSSYADCDDDFVRRSLPPGLVPFWAVDNISLASNNFTYNSDFQTTRLIGSPDTKRNTVTIAANTSIAPHSKSSEF